VSLNRCEVGLSGNPNKSALDEVAETYGFPANAIVSMKDVVEHLYNRPCQGKIIIDDAMKAAIDAYYAEYGVK
jgi:orotate phosphoribosyltransferase